ncbi:hypothetical protein [Terrabacter sp. BE26]|uniref:hypothetical protein n=1 Tax=Terrabacter sp. BE26 TaxID=2898152 RepID=UPI0035BE6C2D
MDFAASTTDALDGVLVREGFAAGQGGVDEVIYCAGHDELSDRFPGLPQANEQPRGLGCCIDLVIDRRGTGLQAHLEGQLLESTLRALHLGPDADLVEGLVAMPVRAALELLGEVLVRLFRAASPDPAWRRAGPRDEARPNLPLAGVLGADAILSSSPLCHRPRECRGPDVISGGRRGAWC